MFVQYVTKHLSVTQKWLRLHKNIVCRRTSTLAFLKVRMLSAARSFHYSRK
jgi:hypothetical protein